MIGLLAVALGPLRKVALWGALGAALVVGAVFLLHQHDARVLAEQRAAEQAQRIAAIQADNARVVAALEADKAALVARQHALERTRRTIYAAPVTTGCASSPALNDALDGLRAPGGRPGAAPSGAQ